MLVQVNCRFSATHFLSFSLFSLRAGRLFLFYFDGHHKFKSHAIRLRGHISILNPIHKGKCYVDIVQRE